jgi:hypothetical protein
MSLFPATGRTRYRYDSTGQAGRSDRYAIEVLADASGVSFADSSGNGHTLTFAAATGITYRVPGVPLHPGPPLGYGIALAETSEQATCTDVLQAAAWTVECTLRLRHASPQGFGALLLNAASTGGVWVQRGTDGLGPNWLLAYYSDVGVFQGQSTGVLLDATSYLAHWRVSGGVGTFFLNGVAAGSFTATPLVGGVFNQVSDASAQLRCLPADLFDDLAVYGTGLSQAQITAHYAAWRGV